MNPETPSQVDRLKKVVRLFRRLKNVAWTDWEDLRQIHGSLEATEGNLRAAHDLEALGLLEGSVGPLPTKPQPGTWVKVTLLLLSLRWGEAVFARKLDEMLTERGSLRFRKPTSFFLARTDPSRTGGYLHAEEETKPAETTPAAVDKYLNTLRLIALLAEVSDKPDERGGEDKELFFKLRRSLTLPIDYGANDLVDLDPSCLKKIEALFQTEIHRHQTRDILKAALLDTLDGTRQRFVDVLARFDDLFRRFDDNYLLFVSEFSFEKIREQAEQHRLTYTAKLNAIFTGIQNKLLAIPAALVIVAGQIKGDEGVSLGNSMVLLGALVFAVLMWLLIRNQRHTLEALHAEMERENRKLGAHAEIREKLQDVYADLDVRYRHHRRLLGWVALVVAVSALLPFAVLGYHLLFPAPAVKL